MADPAGFAGSSPGIAGPGGGNCPLLALDLAVDAGPVGDAARPGPGSVSGGRCTATSPAPAISAAQRRLVCEDARHLDCPRYVRATKGGRGPVAGRTGRVPAAPVVAATVVATEPAGAPPAVATEASVVAEGSRGEVGDAVPPTATGPDPAPAAPVAVVAAAAAEPSPAVAGAPPGPDPVPVRPVTRASGRSGARPAGSRPLPIVVAGAILVVCLVVAFAFTSLRGGLSLPAASPGTDASGAVAATSPSPAATGTVGPSASSDLTGATPSASAVPTASPSPGASLDASPSPGASGAPGPSPTASLPAAYVGLKPCPGKTGCYLYRIRSGDSLTKVAQRFGVTLAAVKALNPDIASPSLVHVGDIVRVPLPKR